MLTQRTCPHCDKLFLPIHIKQIYCRPTHKEAASRRRRADRGDIKIVKVCNFVITGWLGLLVALPTRPLYMRCSLESGHKGDHLIRVENAADLSLDSKSEGSGTHG